MVGNSIYYHSWANLETYNNQPFVAGSHENTKVELMNSDTFEWTAADDYPNAPFGLKLYGSTSTETAVFIFAGNHNVQPPREIAKFENMRWTILGELLQPRRRPFIYRNGNSISVMGGSGVDDLNERITMKIVLLFRYKRFVELISSCNVRVLPHYSSFCVWKTSRKWNWH